MNNNLITDFQDKKLLCGHTQIIAIDSDNYVWVYEYNYHRQLCLGHDETVHQLTRLDSFKVQKIVYLIVV